MSAAAQLATANVLPVQAGPRDARTQDDTAGDGGAAFESLLDGSREGDAPRSAGERVGMRGAPDRASGDGKASVDADGRRETESDSGGAQPLPQFVYSLMSLAMSASDVSGEQGDEELTQTSLSPDLGGMPALPQMPAVAHVSDGVSAVSDADGAALTSSETSTVPSFAVTVDETEVMALPQEAVPENSDGAREALTLLATRQRPAPQTDRPSSTAAAAADVQVFDFAEQRESMSLKVVRQETHLAMAKPGAADLALLLAANRGDAPAKGEVVVGDADALVSPGKADASFVAPQPVLADGASTGRGAMNFAGQGGGDTGERGAQRDGAPSLDGTGQATNAGFTVTPRLVEAAAPSEVSDVPPPATQIAERVASAISSGEVSDTSTDGAVRVLHIELKPHNLGSVTVRVSLKDNAVTMHIEAQRHETATAIEREREALSTALKQAGYVVDGITAQTAVDRPRADGAVSASGTSGSMTGSERQMAGQSDQGFANPGQRGSSGQREASTEPRGGSGRGINDTQQRPSRERSGALYV